LEMCPRHSPALVRRVLDLLRSALLHTWSEHTVPGAGFRVLRHLVALEALREGLERDAGHEFGSRLAGPDGADFLAEVLHDLRSPLTSVLFLAQTLERGRSGPVNDLQRRQLRLIHVAALRLGIVVSDAIDLARGGDPLRSEEPVPFSVTRLLESVRDIVRPMAEEKGLELRFIRPQRDGRVGRELVLQRVLLNLVSNALKFTQAGQVEVAAQECGDVRVEFSVRDTGPGMSATDDLFRPFSRAPQGRHRFSSTGLGLAVSRRLVEALGGTLRYETGAGAGTRFWFDVELPAAVE
ncbi:MAG TPA: HAMP domain-containing sensor histidine kinase, partial [bacterium]|nr:HAMP domain-containing sensor histidine kinase [bacterium]